MMKNLVAKLVKKGAEIPKTLVNSRHFSANLKTLSTLPVNYEFRTSNSYARKASIGDTISVLQ
jgi:hypothetical protein